MITHKIIDGVFVQIVTPAELKKFLDESGENYERPEFFNENDEWEVEVETQN